jgi:hypothetical protein
VAPPRVTCESVRGESLRKTVLLSYVAPPSVTFVNVHPPKFAPDRVLPVNFTPLIVQFWKASAGLLLW